MLNQSIDYSRGSRGEVSSQKGGLTTTGGQADALVHETLVFGACSDIHSMSPTFYFFEFKFEHLGQLSFSYAQLWLKAQVKF